MDMDDKDNIIQTGEAMSTHLVPDWIEFPLPEIFNTFLSNIRPWKLTI